MNILVTNDDGYTAPGLLILKQALEKVGTVAVVAPDQNWSAGGHVKTLHKPLRLSKEQLADGSEAYASSGAPSDCVSRSIRHTYAKISALCCFTNSSNSGFTMTPHVPCFYQIEPHIVDFVKS